MHVKYIPPEVYDSSYKVPRPALLFNTNMRMSNGVCLLLLKAKSVADAVTSIANLKEAQDDESDGIQSELSALAEKVNKVRKV